MSKRGKIDSKSWGSARIFTSVAGKFTLGLMTWFAAAVIINIFGLVYLSSFQNSIETLTRTTLPTAENSAKLAVETTALAGKVRQFSQVDTQVKRRLIMKEIQTELDRIEALHPDLRNTPDFETFTNVLATINQSVSRLDSHIMERIRLTNRTTDITSQLIAFNNSDFVEMIDITMAEDLSVLKWRGQLSAIITMAIENKSLTKLREARLLERQLKAEFRRAKILRGPLDQQISEALALEEEKIKSLFFQKDGYVDTLIKGLRITVRVRGVENQVLTLNEEITKLSAEIFERATEQVITDALAVKEGVLYQINYTLLAGLGLLITTILLGIYLHKTVVLRLNRLNDEVKSYSQGDDQKITVSGIDEISDISHSIHNFIEEIETQQEALIRAKVRAESAAQSKSEFLATMSHEIRTPMNGVITMTEMLKKTPLNSKQRELATIVHQSANSLLTIINDVLDFSRIEAGKLEIEKADYNLNDLVSGVAALCGADAYAKNLELYYKLDESIPDTLIGDSTRIRQVLLNLTSNAVKFTEQGQVDITVTWAKEAQNPTLLFTVTDTGIGISQEASNRLFQAFEQADSSTVRKFGGSGLGLSISKRLAEMMDGTITHNSTLGTGSQFFFTLPVDGPTQKADPIPETIAKLGDFILVSYNSRTTDLLSKELMPFAEDIVILDPRKPAEWDCSIKKIRSDTVHLLIDKPCLDDDRQANLKEFSDANACISMVLCPRAHFEYLDQAEGQWLHGAIAKPLNIKELHDTILDNFDPVKDKEKADHQESDIYTRDAAEERGEIVLIAEDNVMNQKIIAKIFENIGLHFDMVDNGEEAIAQLHNTYYSILLTDFHMPKMDGLMLTKSLKAREEPEVNSLPIVMLTADAQVDSEEMCREAGVDGFLTKPIIYEDLVAELRKYMPEAKPLLKSEKDEPFS
ncbi:ATP-binding protein [Temperatibacter marinus]|uniref:Sensory/regulatory protein RpfC n=1 Tax=Temperatibacter marinus TaxID=1456591 RepID=A0AA52HAA5_9PROT|nr:ATP-binding protein [Temperatibacter marinus]WND03759.1 ATP-binding protein [Temperatibacter marinus]